MTEDGRTNRNQQRLTELFPSFAARIRKLIADLEAEGLRPRIQDAYRSPQDQLKAFETGKSKLKFGFHNITGSGGRPEALAVDLLDDDHPLRPPTAYLLHLAVVARKYSLMTGIAWGLPANLAKGVEQAISTGDFAAAVKIGWDPTHVEVTGITVAEAKGGKRPT